MQFSIKSFVTQLILFSDLNGDLHNELSKECLLKKNYDFAFSYDY